MINVDRLEELENGSTVTLDTILEHGLASMNTRLLKVLGNGELTKQLEVHAQKFSKSAVQKIEAAGGKAVVISARQQPAAAGAGAAEAPQEGETT